MMGRPQKTKGRNIIFEALQALPEDGKPIRFKDLRTKVKMSSATLSKALFYLCSNGQVIKFQVHSQRGKGITYQKVPTNPASNENWNKNIRELLIKNKRIRTTSENILSDFEFFHAQQLCINVSTITQAIFNALKSYADSNKYNKDAVLETHLYVIKGLITELSKNMINDIGMSNFTYNICFRGCATLSNNLYGVLEDASKVMGWEDNGMKGLKNMTYLSENPAEKLKELLQGNRLEIEKLKQEKESVIDCDDCPGYNDYIKTLDDKIKYLQYLDKKEIKN